MRCLVVCLFLSSFLFAQNAKPTNTQPSKDNPQGYWPEMFEDGKTKTVLGRPATYTPPSSVEAEKIPADLQAVVKAQFGPDFIIATDKSDGLKYKKPQADTWVPFLTADLDGDGVEDAIIVTRCSKPLSKETEFHYKVIDPYFTANGFGDPRVTAAMNSDDPDHNFSVLIIHGAGPKAWRAAKPKSKFVVVNLPFDSLSITQVLVKKKKPAVAALEMDEVETSGSVMFWDGKKYKWREGAGN